MGVQRESGPRTTSHSKDFQRVPPKARTIKRMALRLSTRSEVAIPQKRKTAQKSLTRNGKRTTSPIKSRKRTQISNKYISTTKCVFRGHTVSESRQYLGCVNE